MEVILIAGLWLRAGAWDAVVAGLAERGIKATALELPGVDDGNTTASLDDQLEAAMAVVDAASGPVAVVGHSAACTLAWLVADRRVGKVDRVALIGGIPQAEGGRYADFFEPRDGVIPFPGWDAFEGPESDDLDSADRSALEALMMPVPVGVARGSVLYTDERRFDLPLALVCPEYSVEDAQHWLAAGEIPSLERANDLSFIDLDSGHWPMRSNVTGLVQVLAGFVG